VVAFIYILVILLLLLMLTYSNISRKWYLKYLMIKFLTSPTFTMNNSGVITQTLWTKGSYLEWAQTLCILSQQPTRKSGKVTVL